MWNSTLYDTTKLTVELGELIENGVHIWDFEYPSYYEGVEKLAFERKVTDHYYFRQIGSETVGRFIHQFRSRVREIMPRYIELYKTVELMKSLDNPFDNVDIVETFEEQTTGTSSGSATGSTSMSDSSSASGNTSDTGTVSASKELTEDKQHKFSNTPQGSISNLDNYMSEAYVDDNSTVENVSNSTTNNNETESTSSSESASNSSTTSESASTGSVTHTLTRKGNQGVNTYAHDIMEYRNSIIDVDMMIINDLNDLFLKVY